MGRLCFIVLKPTIATFFLQSIRLKLRLLDSSSQSSFFSCSLLTASLSTVATVINSSSSSGFFKICLYLGSYVSILFLLICELYAFKHLSIITFVDSAYGLFYCSNFWLSDCDIDTDLAATCFSAFWASLISG